MKKAPSERLYGAYELLTKNYEIIFCDSRFEGLSKSIYEFFQKIRLRHLPIDTIRKIASCDYLILKDDFYTLAAITGFLLRKKVIYMDSLFNLPANAFRRLVTRINLRLASKVLVYSSVQANIWLKAFPELKKKISVIEYPIDRDFYNRNIASPKSPKSPKSPNLLKAISVGRDLGRDNSTLIEACKSIGLNLTLVTLPYLVPKDLEQEGLVKIKENLSYEKLFAEYKESTLSIVPLKKGLIYPSGIRAILESMAIGVPVIAARTPIIEELFLDNKNILLYSPENIEDLSLKIITLLQNDELRAELIREGLNTTKELDIKDHAEKLYKKILQ